MISGERPRPVGSRIRIGSMCKALIIEESQMFFFPFHMMPVSKFVSAKQHPEHNISQHKHIR